MNVARTQANPAIEATGLSGPSMAAASPEVFNQLGLITRHLHDALNQLGVMPKLRYAADKLPDARSRLGYIALKTGEAADKVLNLVDEAKLEHRNIVGATQRMAAAIGAAQQTSADTAAMMDFVGEIEAATARIDRHLTAIMMAQDFHDLTGQVVAKVATLATDLEDSLVKLLMQAAPQEQVLRAEAAMLHGPVVSAERSADVVTDQGEVDDLLASLGF